MAGGPGLHTLLLVDCGKLITPGSLRKGGIKIYPPKVLSHKCCAMIG